MFPQNPQQFTQHGTPQPDLANILGTVIQASLPVILNSLRGQQSGIGGQAFGAPGLQSHNGHAGQGYGGQTGAYGVQGYGAQGDVSSILGPVLQATLPIILGALRGQQAGGFGQGQMPAFQGQGQAGAQTDLGTILGPVLQATLPIVLGALRGQQAGGTGQQFGQGYMPAFQSQNPYGQQGQSDVGNVIASVLQAMMPALVGSSHQGQQGQQHAGWRA